MPVKVLLTGASGFIGKRVLEHLKKSDEFEPILLTSAKIEGYRCIDTEGYEFDADYLLANGCDDVSIVLHMGAFTPKHSSEANQVFECTSNVLSTNTLLAACSKIDQLKKIVYVSSLDVYGSPDGVIDENSSTNPITLYGWSKLFSEKMIASFAKEQNLTYDILRIGHVYGEGEESYKKVIPEMIKSVISGNPINIYGDRNALRSFIYIDDVVQSIVNSLALPNSIVINIVGDTPISIEKLAYLIASFSVDSTDILFNKDNGVSRDYVFNTSVLESLLLSHQTDLREGLKKEYEYMKRIDLHE